MEIENTFDIRIPDIASEKARTVDDLHTIVWNLVKDNESTPSQCMSQKIFYKLRSMIKEELLVNEQISPTTLLEEIFPELVERKYGDNWRLAQRSNSPNSFCQI